MWKIVARSQGVASFFWLPLLVAAGMTQTKSVVRDIQQKGHAVFWRSVIPCPVVLFLWRCCTVTENTAISSWLHFRLSSPLYSFFWEVNWICNIHNNSHGG
jgi:hypothetical protein